MPRDFCEGVEINTHAQCAILKCKSSRDQFIRIYGKSERLASSQNAWIYSQIKPFFMEKNYYLYLWTNFMTDVTINMYFGSQLSSYLFILDYKLSDSHR